jgi:hypothetical protein
MVRDVPRAVCEGREWEPEELSEDGPEEQRMRLDEAHLTRNHHRFQVPGDAGPLEALADREAARIVREQAGMKRT